MIKSLALLLICTANVSLASAKPIEDLPNFQQVNPNLYRGGRPTIDGLKRLSQLGIKTVIDLQGGDLRSVLAPVIYFTEQGERKANINKEYGDVEALHMNFRNYPIDSIRQKLDRTSIESINEALKDIEDPSLQPVYIHCEHGKDRTGLVVAIERIQDEKWSVQDAKAEWIKLGHGTLAQIVTAGLDRYFKKLFSY